MHRGRSGDIFAPLEATVGPAIVGYEPARFLDQQDACRGVPRVEIVFPETVHPAGRDPGEIERRSTETADSRDLRADGGVNLRPACGIAAPAMGNASADHAFVEVATGRYAQASIVQPGAPALLGPEALVGQRLVDQRLGDFAAP